MFVIVDYYKEWVVIIVVFVEIVEIVFEWVVFLWLDIVVKFIVIC